MGLELGTVVMVVGEGVKVTGYVNCVINWQNFLNYFA